MGAVNEISTNYNYQYRILQLSNQAKRCGPQTNIIFEINGGLEINSFPFTHPELKERNSTFYI